MGKRILVVDDEKLIVKGIRFSLEQEGMEVDCAYDGEEALEYAKACEYDLVLLDVMLPKLGGFEICRTLRVSADSGIFGYAGCDADGKERGYGQDTGTGIRCG